SYKKNLKKTNVTYYKFSNCDCGFPARLIVRNNEISERGQHNCKANRLVIQIPGTNISPESFFETFIFEKASQLGEINLSIPRIASHRKINYQRTAGFNRNEFDPSSHVSSIKFSSNQPFFRRYWVGGIH
ncbi:hypothetical protein HZS_3427, partial [Henneguya salminicola]